MRATGIVAADVALILMAVARGSIAGQRGDARQILLIMVGVALLGFAIAEVVIIKSPTSGFSQRREAARLSLVDRQRIRGHVCSTFPFDHSERYWNRAQRVDRLPLRGLPPAHHLQYPVTMAS